MGTHTLMSAFLAIACSNCSGDKQKVMLPFFNSASLTPEWISPTSPAYNHIHAVAPFDLYDQEGNKVSDDTFKGNPYVANFFFTTCPGLCPKLGASFKSLQDSLQSGEVKLVSHTVMPSYDSVAVLKRYADNNGVIAGRWFLLTGEKSQLYELARNSYFADKNFNDTGELSEFIHTENILLVDSQSRIRGVYNGTLTYEINRLLRHIKILQDEKE